MLCFEHVARKEEANFTRKILVKEDMTWQNQEWMGGYY